MHTADHCRPSSMPRARTINSFPKVLQGSPTASLAFIFLATHWLLVALNLYSSLAVLLCSMAATVLGTVCPNIPAVPIPQEDLSTGIHFRSESSSQVGSVSCPLFISCVQHRLPLQDLWYQGKGQDLGWDSKSIPGRQTSDETLPDSVFLDGTRRDTPLFPTTLEKTSTPFSFPNTNVQSF